LIPPLNSIAAEVVALGTMWVFIGISGYYLLLIIIEMVKITRRRNDTE
jgi:hypothetical protein